MSDVWLNIVMVFVFVLIGGAFSGAEIALVSLRESQVRAMAENEGRRGKAVQRLLSDPNRFLAAVQVGVTLAGFFSAAFGASTLSAPLAEWLQGRGVSAGLAEHARPGPRHHRDQLPVARRRRADPEAAGPAAGRGLLADRGRAAQRDRHDVPADHLAAVEVDGPPGAALRRRPEGQR